MQDIQINAKAEICPHCNKPIRIVAMFNGQEIELPISGKQSLNHEEAAKTPSVPKKMPTKWRKKWSDSERLLLLQLNDKYNGMWTDKRIKTLGKKLQRNEKSVGMQIWKIQNNKIKIPPGYTTPVQPNFQPVKYEYDFDKHRKAVKGLKKGTKLNISPQVRAERKRRIQEINAIAKVYQKQGYTWQEAIKKASKHYKDGGRNTQA